jgi:hypothetical protein
MMGSFPENHPVVYYTLSTCIVGNETADQLAKAGSDHPLIGPEPACGISIGVAKKAVRDWMSRKHQEYWESLTGLRQA